jgi:hypothetical protein
VAGIVAILAGLAVGAVTGGLISGTSGFGKTNVGVPAVEAWATAIGIYLIAMYIARFLPSVRARQVLLGLPAAEPVGPGAGVTETAIA